MLVAGTFCPMIDRPQFSNAKRLCVLSKSMSFSAPLQEFPSITEPVILLKPANKGSKWIDDHVNGSRNLPSVNVASWRLGLDVCRVSGSSFYVQFALMTSPLPPPSSSANRLRCLQQLPVAAASFGAAQSFGGID
jgi:hypothetical protein